MQVRLIRYLCHKVVACIQYLSTDPLQTPQNAGFPLVVTGGGGLTGLTDILDGPMMSPMSSQPFSPPPMEGGAPGQSLGPDDPVGDSLLGWGLGPLGAWNPDPDGADSSLSSESLAGLADLIAKGGCGRSSFWCIWACRVSALSERGSRMSYSSCL